MRQPGPELIERLAAEYVLGTLRGRARARFDRWLADDDAMRRRLIQVAVRRWEDRLVHLADEVPSITPSPEVWQQILRRTGATAGATEGPRRARAPWTRWALVASVMLVAIAAWLWIGRETQDDWRAVAELRDPARAEALWRIEIDRDRGRLGVVADRPYALTASQVHELWALPGAGRAPVSLGLLPQSGRLERELTAAQRDAIAVAPQLAVSLEPAGGSPTGAPTGPVLVVVETASPG